MEKIIILDNNSMAVHVFPFDTNIYDTEDMYQFYDDINDKYSLNLKDSECSWMLVKNLKIEIH